MSRDHYEGRLLQPAAPMLLAVPPGTCTSSAPRSRSSPNYVRATQFHQDTADRGCRGHDRGYPEPLRSINFRFRLHLQE